MYTIDARIFTQDVRELARKYSDMLANDAKQVSIFVPVNIPAGQYAGIIHDKKGSAWRKRGVGTVAKGGRADEKYIERAISDNSAKINTMLRAGWAAAVAAAGKGRKMAAALLRIGFVVQREARANAPRSPSKSQYKQTLKTARGRKNSVFDATPGGLEDSIKYEVK